MKISITFRHMEATDAIRDHIESKLDPIKKWLIKPIEVHVTLTVEKFRHTAEVILTEQSFSAKALETTDDMYASIDLAIHKVENQLKKHKEKVQEHHKHHSATHDVAAMAETEYLRKQSL